LERGLGQEMNEVKIRNALVSFLENGNWIEIVDAFPFYGLFIVLFFEVKITSSLFEHTCLGCAQVLSCQGHPLHPDP
jgi:hypothetical protein